MYCIVRKDRAVMFVIGLFDRCPGVTKAVETCGENCFLFSLMYIITKNRICETIEMQRGQIDGNRRTHRRLGRRKSETEGR